MERLAYLSYLLEGSYDGYEKLKENYDILTSSEIEERFKKYPWIEDAWRAFDTASDLNGENPFHLSIVIGNIEIIKYLICFIKLRERYMKHF